MGAALTAWLVACGVQASEPMAATLLPFAPVSPSFVQEAGGSTAQSVEAAVKPSVDEDPVSAVFETACVECHETSEILQNGRRSARGWALVVDDMVRRGARGTAAELTAIKAYLFRHHGRVNVNKASRDDLALVLDISVVQATALVEYRAAHGEFTSVADIERATVIDATTLKSLRERISFTGE